MVNIAFHYHVMPKMHRPWTHLPVMGQAAASPFPDANSVSSDNASPIVPSRITD
jgi:hypothetical protein